MEVICLMEGKSIRLSSQFFRGITRCGIYDSSLVSSLERTQIPANACTWSSGSAIVVSRFPSSQYEEALPARLSRRNLTPSSGNERRKTPAIPEPQGLQA
ncbi:MAG: hypothetical protein Q9169_000779 [Polycauliona sp. 2 TL-2023]